MNVSWSTSAAVSASGGRLRMPPKTHRAAKVMLSLAASSLAWAASVSARPQAIDIRKSVMTVHVGKAGLFSAFGHDHDIAAPISAGSAVSEAVISKRHLTWSACASVELQSPSACATSIAAPATCGAENEVPVPMIV